MIGDFCNSPAEPVIPNEDVYFEEEAP